MIFFNRDNAKHELMHKGLVYTLRSEFRKTGETDAVYGSMAHNTKLCQVLVDRVMKIDSLGDLHPYVHQSGFGSVDDWITAAASSARTLYRVTRVGD